MSIQFDHATSTLQCSTAELADVLADLLAGAFEGSTRVAMEPAAPVTPGAPDDADHLLARLIGVAAEGERSAVIEQLTPHGVSELRVALGPTGDVTLTEVGPGDTVRLSVVTLTELRSVLVRRLRIDVGGVPSASESATLTVSEFDAVMHRWEADASEPLTFGTLEGTLIGGWRVSAAWRGFAPSAAVTVLNAGSGGCWSVETDRRTTDVGSTDPVRLVPMSGAAAMRLLGAVITGRALRRVPSDGHSLGDDVRPGGGESAGGGDDADR